jgi:glucose-1-phosphate cytidylyltransferase
MKTVILCGGQGTRLREETEYRPKPLVDVGGRPILWHIMKNYAHHGHHEFVLCLGYRGQMIKEYFLNYEAMTNDFTISLGSRQGIRYHDAPNEGEFEVTLADTGLDTMTGGRLKRVARYLDGDVFGMTYGDGLSDVDLTKVWEFHKSHGKLATVTTVRPISRFGTVRLAEDGLVHQFAEKPIQDNWISAGFFILDRRVLDYIDGDETIFEQEPLQRLADEGQLMAYRHDGFFYAMDTYREYLLLNELWNSGDAPWKVWE